MTLLEDAVGTNAAWCATVCGGPGTEPHTGCWLAPTDPPPSFPDLVTRRPHVPATDVAEVLRDRPTCSVKDSFADLDLTAAGFRVLLDATWVGRAAGRPGGRRRDGAAKARRRGATNVFDPDPWDNLLALHVGADVVGYEHGADLAAACAAGLAPLGPLRIRVRERPSAGRGGASARPAC